MSDRETIIEVSENLTKDEVLKILLSEYDKLKSEQTARIGFRDNLLYVTLFLFATVISFAISKSGSYYGLLVIPWICLILGWTYLVNDEKISAIGRYVREELVDKLIKHTGYKDVELFFGWEIAHRNDKHRIRRKIEQLIIDEITFVFSGVIALISFWYMVPNPFLQASILFWIEVVLLIVLQVEIWIYADLKKGR